MSELTLTALQADIDIARKYMRPMTVEQLRDKLNRLCNSGRGDYRVDVLSNDAYDFGAVLGLECHDRECFGVKYIDLVTNLESTEVSEK